MTKFLTLSLLLACSLSAATKKDSTPTPPKPADSIRTVMVGPKTVVSVDCAVDQYCSIQLPPGELKMNVYVGNPKLWSLAATKVPTAFVNVTPVGRESRKSSTTLTIITNHNLRYVIALHEITGVEDTFDAAVVLEPEAELKAVIEQPPPFVPATELDRVKAEAELAKKNTAEASAAAIKAAQEQANAFQMNYPRTLQFPYRWNIVKGNSAHLETIWHDEKFTYIRAHPQELLALYEIKDKKPSAIQYSYSNGLYVITKILSEGYLEVGKLKVPFYSEN